MRPPKPLADDLPIGRRPVLLSSPLRLAQDARSRLQHSGERRTLLASHRVGRMALLPADRPVNGRQP